MLKILEPLSSTTIITTPYWSYRHDRYRLPSGRIGEYHYVHTPGSVMIVPFLNDDTLLLIRQYRYLNRAPSIEFPGGGHSPDIPIEESARRELIGETGYTARQWEALGTFNPCNGLTDEICHVFIARDLQPTTEVQPDESEQFELLTVTPPDIRQLVANGDIWDGMTLATLTLLTLKSQI